MKVTGAEANCFSNQALVFNELSKSVRCSPTVNSFKHETKKYYMDKAPARSLSMYFSSVVANCVFFFTLFCSG